MTLKTQLVDTVRPDSDNEIRRLSTRGILGNVVVYGTVAGISWASVAWLAPWTLRYVAFLALAAATTGMAVPGLVELAARGVES